MTETAPPPLPPARPRRAWWASLALLAGYVLGIGALSALQPDTERTAVLSPDPLKLLLTVGYELLIFTVVFLVACRVSRVTADELLLRWRGGWLPVVRGVGYSVALRLFVGIVLVACLAVYAVITGVKELDQEKLQELRPKIEVLVEPEALANDPLYLWLNLTLVSFVMAGLREELWRAGMLAAMRALWPRWFGSLWGGIGASAIIAVAFGLAHAPQGWAAMVMTGLLGFGLGAIMVFHRSIWDAVLAHGFFNATSFAMLWYLANHHPEMLGAQ